MNKINLDGNTATGVEFTHAGKTYNAKAAKEVILSGGVINSPQVLELSGIGDPKVLKDAGVECKVKNLRVGANFQDHVLGGMLYELADGITSMDSMHTEAYAKKVQEKYAESNDGLLASPGMLMGFVSYASLVSKEQLEDTIKEIRDNSLAVTDFEKRQEDVVVKQLSDPTFANLQTFCMPPRAAPNESILADDEQVSHASSMSVTVRIKFNSSLHRRRARTAYHCSSAWSIRCLAARFTSPLRIPRKHLGSIQDTSAITRMRRSWQKASNGLTKLPNNPY